MSDSRDIPLIQRTLITKYRNNNRCNEYKQSADLRKRINASLQKSNLIKSGISITTGFKEKSFEDTLDWALRYADNNESVLMDELFSLENEIKLYTSYTTEKVKIGSPRKHHLLVPEAFPTASLKASLTSKGKQVGGANNKEMQKDVRKNRIPLAQRLDKLRIDRTDDFIAEITRTVAPKKVKVPGRKNSAGSIGLAFRSVVNSVIGNLSTASTHSNVPIISAHPKPPAIEPPSTTTSGSHGRHRKPHSHDHTHRSKEGAGELTIGEVENSEVFLPGETSLPSPSSPRSKFHLGSPRSNSPTSKSPRPEKIQNKGEIRYLNRNNNIDNGAVNLEEESSFFQDVATANAANGKYYENKTEAIAKKLTNLQEGFAKKSEEANHSGHDLLDLWSGFRESKKLNHEQFLFLFEHNEFVSPAELKMYMVNFQPSGFNCAGYIKKLKQKVRRQIYVTGMDNLIKAQWLLDVINKFEEYTRKTKQSIPICCFRFLSVVKNLIMFGWELTQDLFYYVLEHTIRNPVEEHFNVLVYKVVKAGYEAAKIQPEAFLEYLEGRGYPPCPELVAQIRENKQKQIRMARLQQIQNQGSPKPISISDDVFTPTSRLSPNHMSPGGANVADSPHTLDSPHELVNEPVPLLNTFSVVN